MEVKSGSEVRSIAGRDKGGLFIVLDVKDGYAYLADGDLRKTDRPKKKKLKHIQASGNVSEFIQNKLSKGQKVTNAELRKALAEMVLR
jgi:large subunit ribosomal protein L14e